MSWFVPNRRQLVSNGILASVEAVRGPQVKGRSKKNKRSILDNQLDVDLESHSPAMSESSQSSRRDSLMNPGESDCDLSLLSDVNELLDAVSKLLNLTELDIAQKRALLADLRSALVTLTPGSVSTIDKSLVVSTLLLQVDNLSLPDDASMILPAVRKIIAVVSH